MATEGEEPAGGLPWYTKFFEYWRNRNRIGPAKVQLPECDFFIVGPRRTLRVLKPTLKSGLYYEIPNDRPESIIDNFFTRWSRRPHSSGNCRCSFRHSSRLSTTEEQIISAELNRIRTSLCETEGNGHAIEELERRVSVNLQKLQVPPTEIEQDETEDKTEDNNKIDTTIANNQSIEDQTMKNKIVKDLEKYINVLLEEILDDTVKYVAKTDDNLAKDTKHSSNESSGALREDSTKITLNEISVSAKIAQKSEAERSSSNEGSFNDISFSFQSGNVEKGYVNPAFIGSTSDPDALDFYLRQSMANGTALEHLDCVDSGINSVETIEFQPDQEPSLEQSLIHIIYEKFGRTALRNSWEDLSAGDQEKKNQSSGCHDPAGRTDQTAIPRNSEHLSNDGGTERSEVNGKNDAERSAPVVSAVETAERIDISADNLARAEKPVADLKELEETVNEPSFEKLRLEFKASGKESSLRAKKSNAVTKLREKFNTVPARESEVIEKKSSWLDKVGSFETKTEAMTIELEDSKKWPDIKEKHTAQDFDKNSDGLVTFRKNKKPMIIFLHGFGSSAEIFEHQLQYFSALGYPCIAPDMLGHGMSSAPDCSRDYHFNKLLTDLDAVLCHYAFKPGQKCVIVAHNYGCSFAAALAARHEGSIHQLVLISGGGPTSLAPPSTESAGHCCLRAVLAPFLMCGLHRDILYSARGRQHPYCGPESPEQWPSHMRYVLNGMIWPEGDYVFHRRICTPTLLVHGLRDNKVSLVQECQMERTMLKAFLEAIPAAAHSPMTECPEQLNHMIHCFIDLWKNKKW